MSPNTPAHPDPKKFADRARQLLAVEVSAAGVPDLVRRNDELTRDVHETYSRLSRAKDANTADQSAAAEFLAFVTQVMPEMQVLGDEMARKLLAVEGYEPPAELATAWATMRDDVELFRHENVELRAQLDELGQRFDQLMGTLEIEVDGQRLTYEAAGALLEEPDRAKRERVYRAIDEAREALRPQLNEIFLQMLALRHRTAQNAGLADFREYSWRLLHRHEYTPDDCLRMHDAVAEVVVPRLKQVYERRKRIMGLDTLRPYDLRPDVRGRAPLKPFNTVTELEEGLVRMFSAVDPAVGEGFEQLRDGWLDIESRPGKVPGLGYQSYFAASRMPFIYMNAVGTDDDMLIMRHEMGHALHTLRTQERWPLLVHMSDRPEMNELASQALEFLTLPYLEATKGGFYSAEDAQRSRASLLVRALELLVQACRIDAIQHFIYTHPGLQDGTGPNAEEIDAAWLEIGARFDVGVDYMGFERSQSRGWQYFHVFQIPFYYIEYAIAYLGALQVWERAREDQAAALKDYLEALSLGATRPLNELYEAAGISFDFDRGTIERLTDLVVQELGDEA